MTTTWTHVLAAWDSDYEKIKRIMEKGPQIKCSIFPVSARKVKIQLVEYWPWDENRMELVEFSERCDDYVYWCEEQLKNWKSVRRTAWDQWTFNNLKDAEKFQTLFNLRWAK